MGPERRSLLLNRMVILISQAWSSWHVQISLDGRYWTTGLLKMLEDVISESICGWLSPFAAHGFCFSHVQWSNKHQLAHFSNDIGCCYISIQGCIS